jgi:formylglycine-generating enzyme required for sulfatase activity
MQTSKHPLVNLLFVSIFSLVLSSCLPETTSTDAETTSTDAETTPINAPTNVQTIAGHKQVTLSWTAVTGADGYNIYKSPSTIGDISYAGSGAYATTNTKTMTGLSNGFKYHFVVTAQKGSTESIYSEEVTATPVLLAAFTEKYGNIEFVKVPKGKFTMGDEEGGSSESPAHTVTFVHDFYVGKYEVTQAQWSTVMGATPSHFSQCGQNCPVEKVSWDSVQTFITNLNRETGKTYRLLSEAEWEYSAKAGTTTDTYAGDLDIKGKLSTSRNAPILDAISYYGGNSGVSYPDGFDCSVLKEKQYTSSEYCGTHPVGGKKPNAFGLYDMIGNVGELTQDCHNEDYKGAPRYGSIGSIWAWVTGDCSNRMARGGS